MASQSEENLSCPICYEIFHDPVLLLCSHSFCKACWQRWWGENRAHECPVCRRSSLQSDPPENLALKNLCEFFLAERVKKAEKASTGAEPLCSLHAEKLKLFCLDHQQPVCVICLHSETHTNHSMRPIGEAVCDYKYALQESLEALQEKMGLFNDIKRNFDQAAHDTEVQAQDTERQIKDVFSILQRFLQKEEKKRIAALREEEEQKSQMLKRKVEDLGKEIAALSDTVRATEEVLGAPDLHFLQNYKTVAERVQQQSNYGTAPRSDWVSDLFSHALSIHSETP